MADANIIREYLVSLGFSTNKAQYEQVQNTLKDLQRSAERHTSGMSRAFVSAAGIVVGTLVGITTATAGVLHKLEESEMGFRKFALHMYTSQDAAKRLKIAMDVMGESLEGIAWLKPLNDRYKELVGWQKTLAEAPGYKETVDKLFHLRTEWDKVQVSFRRFIEFLASSLDKMWVIDKFKGFLESINSWFNNSANMEEWAQTLASISSTSLKMLESLGKFIKDIPHFWGGLSPEAKKYGIFGALLGLGGIALSPSPLLAFIGLITGFLFLLKDFYADSSDKEPFLKKFWVEFDKFKADPKGTLNSWIDKFVDWWQTTAIPTLERWRDQYVLPWAVWLGEQIGSAIVTGVGIGMKMGGKGLLKDFGTELLGPFAKLFGLETSMDKAKRETGGSKALPERGGPTYWQQLKGWVSGNKSSSGSLSYEQMMSHLTNSGLSREDAAAIVGNWMGESGGDPNIHQKGGGPGYGLSQWSDPQRKADLARFAASRGVPISDARMQMDMTIKELRERRIGGLTVMDRLANAKTLAEKTYIVEKYHESPASMGDLSKRIGWASEALKSSNTGGKGVSTSTHVGKIEINGAQDPIATGKAVRKELESMNDISTSRALREMELGYA